MAATRLLLFVLSLVSFQLNSCCAGPVFASQDASTNGHARRDLVDTISVARRAIPDSPSRGYAPSYVDCPADRPTVRAAGSLSNNETIWLPIRRNNTIEPMISLLSRANIAGFNATDYINEHASNGSALPNIGIAISGGGYRALMNGAGFLAAADSRTAGSTGSGQIGGLLQATTYLSGLSGGSWLVGSIFQNNFSSVVQLRDGSPGSSVWQFGNSILQGPESSGLSIGNTAEYYQDLKDEVQQKADAGFNTSITDYWGRALSFQLINATYGGPAYTFSSIAETDSFVNGQTPFPLIVADGRAPNTQIISLNSTIFEFTPFEMGSWDSTMYAFAPLRYVGSKFDGGVVPSNESCVRGFDNAGYVMGTSSTLFNQFLLQFNGSTLPSFLSDAITDVLTDLGEDNDDIAIYGPNPFYKFNTKINENAQSPQLTLVDGGEDGQNIPFNPLLQQARGVDVIFAVDSSADNSNWPDGTSIVATYERSKNSTIRNETAFPSIPGQNTFVNLGLNLNPTFFGCNASNTTQLAPLVVYIPNAPYMYHSNVSTFQLALNNTERNLIIENGYDVATLGNGTLDSSWPTCIACAILSRSFFKTNTAPPDACVSCFDKYCWNGTLAPSTPSPYWPPYLIEETQAESGANSEFMHQSSAAAILAFAVCMLFLL